MTGSDAAVAPSAERRKAGGVLRRLAGSPMVGSPARGRTLARHLAVAVVALAIMWYLTDHVEAFYDFQIATIAAYLCVVAGLTVLTGLNGQVSLGHSALMAVGAYTVGLLLSKLNDHNVRAQWTVLLALALGVLTTSVAGVVIGLAAARLRGPYLAGLTLAIVVVVPSIATQFGSLFHGDQGVPVPAPPAPTSLGQFFPQEEWDAWIALAAAGITLFFLANLVHGRVGRNLRAVRDHEAAAQLAGINVARTQVTAFVVSAACAGLGGGVIAVINQSASPDSFALTLSLYLLLAIVLGGLGSLYGAIWGSVAIVWLPYLTNKVMNGLTLSAAEAAKLRGNVPLAIFGLALVIIAIAAPGGIQGLLRRAGRWARARFASRVPQPPSSTGRRPETSPPQGGATHRQAAGPEGLPPTTPSAPTSEVTT
ncbi:MAG TPA: branched-chain amino acid ABC transporter permease [Micromonosporaceae bacterium]|nr:branched-chain amino acid ABC transporter permease [Micromonosporaceae bacterium]